MNECMYSIDDLTINLTTCININSKTHYIVDVDGEFINVVSIYDIMMSCQIVQSRYLEDQWAIIRLVRDV